MNNKRLFLVPFSQELNPTLLSKVYFFDHLSREVGSVIAQYIDDLINQRDPTIMETDLRINIMISEKDTGNVGHLETSPANLFAESKKDVVLLFPVQCEEKILQVYDPKEFKLYSIDVIVEDGKHIKDNWDCVFCICLSNNPKYIPDISYITREEYVDIGLSLQKN